MTSETELMIETLGERGDGIATLSGERVIVPFTVPGDRVLARISRGRGDRLHGGIARIISGGRGRTEPPCRHFGECGGCALQHLGEGLYRAWKLERLTAALARYDIGAETIEPLAISPPRSRRRADLAVSRRANSAVVGFHPRQSHQVVDLQDCHVLRPKLVALIEPLRHVLTAHSRPGDSAELRLTESDSGIDLLLVSARRWRGAAREQIIALATAQDVARVAVAHPLHGETEIVIERRPVRVVLASVPVLLPPGTFLQATAEGEIALGEVVLEAASGGRRAVDLFAGIGTFSFPLAKAGLRVLAVDAAKPPLESAATAARATMLASLRIEVRDLYRRPIDSGTLDRFDLVVFDPPRAGAKEQAAQIAKSRAPTVVAISCNPGTFARDARLLIDGGYRLVRIRPVDQFLWSPHLELAAVFKRYVSMG